MALLTDSHFLVWLAWGLYCLFYPYLEVVPKNENNIKESRNGTFH